MSHVLIVGQKFSSLITHLTENGHSYVFLQDKSKTKFPEKKFKSRALADFSSEESILKAVDSIKKPIDAVLTTYENYVLPAAQISRHLGLPGMPVSAAEACTDKFLMRSLFAKAPEKISPAFATVDSEESLQEFAANHNFPLILKPANLAKSLLVTKNHNLEELLDNFRKSTNLLSSTYAKYAPNRTPKLIVEEFLEGSIHSVDAFVGSDGTPHVLSVVVDYKTGYDIGYDDNFHYSRVIPSKLTESDQQALRHCAEVGIRVLGMKNSPAHVEIIMTKNGPRIVEIGARNGGYRERMHALANNINITAAAIATAAGETADIKPSKNDHVAVLELFPKTPGNFIGIKHQEELEKLPSINYLSVKAKPGQFIGKAADGYKMAAVVILSSYNQNQFEQDLAFVTEHCQVETQAS